jgi:hypothetical protein
MWNGGLVTLEGWIDDGAGYDWIQKLDDLPLQANYTNLKADTFYFSHAGFTVAVLMKCGVLNLFGVVLIF